MNCAICDGELKFFAGSRILGKYDIEYLKCESCGFIRTQAPFWLDEAYTKVINRSDVGLVARNIALSGLVRSVISVCLDPEGRFLDYGGGYGLFVRLMRDAGYDFHYYDKHSQENHFAKGFEKKPQDESGFDLVTAFEVLEHMEEPVAEIGTMLALSQSLLVTTQLLPAPPPKPEEWWYYGLDHGQHISFYTLESLSRLANRFSLNLYSNSLDTHLFTVKKINPIVYKYMTSRSGIRLVNMFHKRKSLIDADYQRLVQSEE